MVSVTNSLYPILQNEAKLELNSVFGMDVSCVGCYHFSEVESKPIIDSELIYNNNKKSIKINVDYVKILNMVKESVINKYAKLIELPISSSNDGSNFTLGKNYKIIDIDGSNFWVVDDFGHKTSIGSCRLEIVK